MSLKLYEVPRTGSPTIIELNDNVNLTLRPAMQWAQSTLAPERRHVQPPQSLRYEAGDDERPCRKAEDIGLPRLNGRLLPQQDIQVPDQSYWNFQDEDKYIGTLIVDEIEQFDHNAFDRDLALLREGNLGTKADKLVLEDAEPFSVLRWWEEVAAHDIPGRRRVKQAAVDLQTSMSLTMVDSDLCISPKPGVTHRFSQGGPQEGHPDLNLEGLRTVFSWDKKDVLQSPYLCRRYYGKELFNP